MLRALLSVVMLLLLTALAQAHPANTTDRGIFQYDLVRKVKTNGVKPLDDGGEPFLDPAKSLLKLQRQVDFQFLPSDFIPEVETEKESFKLKALRYAVGYYKDCEVSGLAGFYDVMVGMRFDTRNGPLEVKYYRVATIINPNKVQLPEDRPSMAILGEFDGSAMLFVLDGSKQELVTFQNLFTDPHAVNFFAADDVAGIRTDESVRKFAIFLRGGASRASLFVINADSSLKELQTFEVLRDLLSTDRVYIFSILPALVPTYRGATLQN